MPGIRREDGLAAIEDAHLILSELPTKARSGSGFRVLGFRGFRVWGVFFVVVGPFCSLPRSGKWLSAGGFGFGVWDFGRRGWGLGLIWGSIKENMWGYTRS